MLGSDLFLNRYRVLGVLGQGGMGSVHRARDEKLQRDVAIKVQSKPDSAELARRFQREAQALARLRHPNILQIFDFGIAPDGRPFLVTDLLQGAPLNEALRTGPLLADQAALLMEKIATALWHVHDQGILHRDIKPHNIVVLAGSEEPILIDFGLARVESITERSSLTEEGSCLGTPEYMAPEQGEGGKVDQRTDVYALGATLFHLLTGQPPFIGATPFAVMKQVFLNPPPDPRSLVPSIPDHLAELCLSCLNKAPDDRPPSARAFLRLLSAGPEAAVPGAFRPRRALAAALLALLALVALLAGSLPWLRSPLGALVIEDLDPGARLSIDGAAVPELGARPFHRALTHGRHHIVVEQNGLSLRRSVEVGAEPTLIKLEGRLAIDAPEAWTLSLYSDDRLVIGRRAPPLRASLPMGRYRLALECPAALSETARLSKSLPITLAAGQILERRLLWSDGGELELTTEPFTTAPAFADLDRDGRDDLVLVLDGRQGAGQIAAFSGAHGGVLWRQSGQTRTRHKPRFIGQGSERPRLVSGGLAADGSPAIEWLDPETGAALGRHAATYTRGGPDWTSGALPFAELEETGAVVCLAWEPNRKQVRILALDREQRPIDEATITGDFLHAPTGLLLALDADGRRDDVLQPLVVQDHPKMGMHAELWLCRDLGRRGGGAPRLIIRLPGAARADLPQVLPRGFIAFSRFDQRGRAIPQFQLSLFAPRSERLHRVFDGPGRRGLICHYSKPEGPLRMVIGSSFSERLTALRTRLQARSFAPGFPVKKDQSWRDRNLVSLDVYRGARPLLLCSFLDRRRSWLELLDPERRYQRVWRSRDFKGRLHAQCRDLDGDGRPSIIAFSERGELYIGEPSLP